MNFNKRYQDIYLLRIAEEWPHTLDDPDKQLDAMESERNTQNTNKQTLPFLDAYIL